MLAVDTNVVVRFLTADDPAQFERAKALFASEDIRVAVTVALETEWVLRSVYAYSPEEVSEALRLLGRLPRLEVENVAAVELALTWHDQGMDFADALHIALSHESAAFATFDEPCRRIAGRLGLAVREP